MILPPLSEQRGSQRGSPREQVKLRAPGPAKVRVPGLTDCQSGRRARKRCTKRPRLESLAPAPVISLRKRAKNLRRPEATPGTKHAPEKSEQRKARSCPHQPETSDSSPGAQASAVFSKVFLRRKKKGSRSSRKVLCSILFLVSRFLFCVIYLSRDIS